ncbi:AAA domain-containing protein [Cladochytrium replicatum]|nr:AAA domain-containing protein [Cladochytrium replicatum]
MRIAQLLLNDGIDDFMIIVHPQFFNQSTGLRMKLSELILRRCYGFNDLRPFLFAQSPTGRFDSRSSWKAPEIPPIVLCPLSTLSVLADDVFYEIFGGKPLNGNDDQLWRNKNQKSGDLRRTTHVFIDEVSQIYVGHLAAPLTRIGMGREGVEKLCFFGDQGGIAPRGKQVTKTFRNVFHALHTRALQFPRFTVRRYFGRPGEIYASESSPIGPIRLFTQHRIPPLISKFIYREICGMSLYDALVFENENGKSPIQKRVERFLPEGASLGQLTIQEANRWDKLVFQNKAEQQEESILPLLFVLNRPHHPRNDLEFVNTLGSESRVEGPGRHSPKYIATFGASILFEHSPGSIQIVTEKNNTPVNQREWTFFNRMEAEVIMRLVLELAVGVVQLDIPIPRKANQLDNVLKVRMEDIAILTLYAGQREYIRRLFSEHLGTLPGACHPCLRVFTADEFLGQECKIGIISTVRTRGVDQLLRDQRRSTALLSRASEKVFVVGNADWFTGSVVADLQEDDDEDVLTNEITRKRDRNAQSTVFGMLAQLCVAGEKVLCACCIPKDRRADTRMYVDNSASFEDTSTGSSAIDLQINPCSEQNIDAMMEDYEVPAQKPSYDLVSCVVREGEGDEVDWDTEDDEIASNRLAAALDSVMLQPSVELDEGFDAEFEDHPGLWMQNGRGRMLTTARDLFGME